MDMNFPHPRRSTSAGSQKADYFALIATATATQATSRTVRALLRGPRHSRGVSDALEGRIDFFSKKGMRTSRAVTGAFLPAQEEKLPEHPTEFESSVNLADSTYGKNNQLETVQPELQVTERGTEL